MAKEDHHLKKEYSTVEFVATLRHLADALEKSERFELEAGREGVSIPAEAKCKIEYEREGKKGEIECQIKWKDR